MPKRKTVRVTESELVDLIDKIVSETVGEKKKRWIAEQKKLKNLCLKQDSLKSNLNLDV